MKRFAQSLALTLFLHFLATVALGQGFLDQPMAESDVARIRHAVVEDEASVNFFFGESSFSFQITRSGLGKPESVKHLMARPVRIVDLVRDPPTLEALEMSDEQETAWAAFRDEIKTLNQDFFRGQRNLTPNMIRGYYSKVEQKTRAAIDKVFLPAQVSLLNEIMYSNMIYNDGLEAITHPLIAEELGLSAADQQRILRAIRERDKELSDQLRKVIAAHYSSILRQTLSGAQADKAIKIISR